MKNVTMFLRDIIKAVVLGTIISVIIGGILFLGGFFVAGFNPGNGLEVGKNGLLLIGSLVMLLLAGMLLVKGKKAEQFTEMKTFRKHYHIIGYKTMLGIICVALILVAALLDAASVNLH